MQILRRVTLLVTIIALIFLSFFFSVGSGSIIGVQDSYAKYFEHAEEIGVFQCFDGSQTIPWRKVNDDVCDCKDGSDEPGTSACVFFSGFGAAGLSPSWKFKCKDTGAFKQEVLHSVVNDGFCDCCDGSDEYLTEVRCPNTCESTYLEELSREEMREKDYEQSRHARMQMIGTLRDQRIKLRENLKKYRNQIELIEFKLQSPGFLNEERKALADRNKLIAESKTIKQQSKCVAFYETDNCSPFGRRVREYHCSVVIDRSISGYCDCGDNTFNVSCGHEDFTCIYSCYTHNFGFIPNFDGLYTFPKRLELEAELEKVRQQLAAHTEMRGIRGIEWESNEITLVDLLYSLDGQNFTFRTNDWIFELEMFKSITQRDITSGASILIGKWKSFGENTYSKWSSDATDYSRMLFTHGDAVGTISRSAVVGVVCGKENKLLVVEEILMGFYELVFSTPALCVDTV